MSIPDTVVPTVNERHARGRFDLLLLDAVRIEAWDRLLFVECGDGWLAEEAWRRMGKGQVCGLSTRPELVALAVQLRGIPGRVEFKAWSGQGFPVPDRGFDRVISCVPWACYLEPAAVLREMARVLAPDGDAYLLECTRSSPDGPRAAQTADLGQLLAAVGLGEVQRYRGDSPPGAWGDGAPPVVIHARQRPTAT